MKFLCLAYEEEALFHAMPREQWDKLRDETLSYAQTLKQSGRLLATEPLQSARKAATVRIREGKNLITDGPFAETKEQLGGFFIIEAQDLEDAIQVALKWPSARLGSIEVRPLEEGLREESRY